MIFYGGHNDNGRELAGVQALCVKSWNWIDLPTHGRGLPTHGHSAAFVERGGGAYVVFVGGGTGSILDDPARCQEHSIAQVLEVGWNPFVGQELSANFLAPVQLTHESYSPGRHHTSCRIGGI